MDAKDQEATFCRWASDHLGLLLKIVRAYAADPANQDDLLQDILVHSGPASRLFATKPRRRPGSTAWRSTPRLRGAGGSAASGQRHRPLLADIAATTPDGCGASSDHQELLARLYAAIRQLPDVDASLILMHLDGLSYHEMAEVLGISENHMGVKLTRIRKELAQLMKDPDDER